jgi:pimeloyl-ACP methyl ester carboxylesterase
MDFASAHPDRVNSLVLMGAGNLEFGERYQMIFRTWLHALESSPSDDLGPYSEVFATWIYSPAYLSASPDFVPNVARTLDKTMARAGTAENLRALIKSYGKEYAERKPRARASCPALFLQGEYDFLTPPAYLKGIERYFPHSILSVVEGAGHNIRVERREEFEKQMMHFFLQDEDF